MRTYKQVPTPRGQKGTTISDINGDRRPIAVLHLPEGTAPEVLSDVTTMMQNALRQGREDRSEEILGDAGLARAAAEVSEHDAELHMSGLSCSCGRFHDPECSGEKWRQHLAYEILQAAARVTR